MKKITTAFAFLSLFFFSTSVRSQEPQEVKKDEKKTEKKTNVAAKKEKKEMAKDVTELMKEDLKVGTGAEAKKGQTVKVHYTGWLTNGKKFDSSVDRGDPFVFPLGAGNVIKGWDEGVAGMKVGGKRKLTIPPSMGYGAQNVGNGLIPPNSTLVFEVELLGVQ